MYLFVAGLWPHLREVAFNVFFFAEHESSTRKSESGQEKSYYPHSMKSFGKTFQEIFHEKLVKILLQYY